MSEKEKKKVQERIDTIKAQISSIEPGLRVALQHNWLLQIVKYRKLLNDLRAELLTIKNSLHFRRINE